MKTHAPQHDTLARRRSLTAGQAGHHSEILVVGSACVCTGRDRSPSATARWGYVSTRARNGQLRTVTHRRGVAASRRLAVTRSGSILSTLKPTMARRRGPASLADGQADEKTTPPGMIVEDLAWGATVVGRSALEWYRRGDPRRCVVAERD